MTAAIPSAQCLHVLAVGPQEPWPATDGGKEGIHGALQALARRIRVTYLCPGAPATEAVAQHYAGIGVDYRPVDFLPRETPGVVVAALLRGKPFKFYKYCTPQAVKRFEGALGDLAPDAVLCFHAHMEQMGQRLRRLRGWRVPVVVREHNIEYEMVSSYRASLPWVWRMLAAPIEWLTRREEMRIWERADMVAFLSDRDLAEARASGANGRLLLAPEGVPIPPRRVARRPSGAELLIPFNWRAAQSAANVRMFLREHWRRVAGRPTMGDVSLTITGADPARLAEVSGIPVDEQRRLRIHALGFLPDLAPAFERALALVAPTFVGSGIRKKVLEGMAHQVPVIATEKDIETCHYFADGQNILRMGDADEFERAVLRLRGDEDLWHALSDNGRTTVERHASWDAFAEVLMDAMVALRPTAHAVPA